MPQDGDSDEFITDLKTSLVINIVDLRTSQNPLTLVSHTLSVKRQIYNLYSGKKTPDGGNSSKGLTPYRRPHKEKLFRLKGKLAYQSVNIASSSKNHEICFQVLRQRTYHDCLLYKLLTVFTHVL